MTRLSALWRLEAFLDREPLLSDDDRWALLSWLMRLQDDPLPSPAEERRDASGRVVRVAVLDDAGVAVAYRLMASGKPRLLRIERLA